MKYIIAAMLIGGLSFSSMANSPSWVGVVTQEIQQSIEYPADAKSKAVEATVWVEFSIDSLGSIENIKPLTNHGHGLEEEVVSAIKKLDRKQIVNEGKYRVPVKFEIR